MCDAGKYKWGENEKTFFDKKNFVKSPDDDLGDMRLFPDELSGSTASATECTGLIQATPVTDDVQSVYESVYNYRQQKPMPETDPDTLKQETNRSF